MDQHGFSWEIFVDGASRNNPGKAGIGFVVKEKNKIIAQHGAFVGILTNNQAEYLALSCALYTCSMLAIARGEHPEKLLIKSDSRLMVQQVAGEFKVKNDQLRKIHSCIMLQLSEFSYELQHVLREFNKEADLLANKGITTRTPLPRDFIDFLSHHCASLYELLSF